MKVPAIHGIPRKKWNPATLLQNTLDGAASAGAETELLHLCDLTCGPWRYEPCRSSHHDVNIKKMVVMMPGEV